MYRFALILISTLSLAACLSFPVLYAMGRISSESYKLLLLGGTVGWFVCAAALAAKNK